VQNQQENSFKINGFNTPKPEFVQMYNKQGLCFCVVPLFVPANKTIVEPAQKTGAKRKIRKEGK